MKENEIDYKKLYEEEHKRYESAISTAKILRDNSDDGVCRKKIEAIFPELAESEDEKIRKAIKLLVEMKVEDSIGLEPVYGVSYREMLAWLEKQGEQKHAWSEEDNRMYKAISIALSLNEAEGYLKSWHTTPEEADNWIKSLKERLQPKQELSENVIVEDDIRVDKLWENYLRDDKL